MTAPWDIASLLTPGPHSPGLEVRYRQGVVREWDPVSAHNTVEVSGQLFTDLPVLNTTEALQLKPGDVVGILVTTPPNGGVSTMAILGRLTIPGSAAAASALRGLTPRSDQIRADEVAVREAFTSSTIDFVDLPTVGPTVTATIDGGSALVIIGADIFTYGMCAAFMSFHVSGPTTVQPAFNRSVGLSMSTNATFQLTVSASRVVYLTQLPPGTYTITAKYHAGIFDPLFQTAEFERRSLAVIPL